MVLHYEGFGDDLVLVVRLVVIVVGVLENILLLEFVMVFLVFVLLLVANMIMVVALVVLVFVLVQPVFDCGGGY